MRAQMRESKNYNAYGRDSDGGLLYVGGVVNGKWDEDAPERELLHEGDAPVEVSFPDGPEGKHVEYYACKGTNNGNGKRIKKGNETRTLTVKITEGFYRQVKVYSGERGLKMRDVVIGALEKLIGKKEQ